MRYAIIENSKVINIAEATPEVATERGWVECPDTVDIGWTFNGPNQFAVPAPDLVAIAVTIRAERDMLLAQTDWRFRSDMNPSQAWVDYCQALRDIPQQSGFPHNVTWPTKPE